ncbi:3',5'-cyclic adenosine monophosphate phosphodiesterase CpdA [Aquicella siphonis]|uniref:3',5'-cyclic adenosine monophosphate phosphodiesterase CpdA n=1 Tax=Aquicella siphonis TaxID=254247 RepID=A0A5E4PF33_9COXI|nr:metallophosphoesterase [Aquicella siphonis]VVC75225.1 3',5'-cyclic adenosine monophosphate phosphodiesterase CpdA [Aquicella siphonis]
MFRPIPPEIASRIEEDKEARKRRIEPAEHAAYAAKPKVYRLYKSSKMGSMQPSSSLLLDLEEPSSTSSEEEISSVSVKKTSKVSAESPLRFFTLGCQGNAKSAQIMVANLMEQVASQSDAPPDFILILGDNFYDWGVDAPDNPMFQTNFHAIYQNPKLGTISKIPCFVILGNHDENLHKLGVLEAEKGVSRGMHQVAHTYLPRTKKYPTTESLQQLYRSHTDDEVVDLDLDNLPSWNMPSRTYSLISGDTQIFCIDSNTYVSDYLKMIAGDENPYNQAIWVAEEVRKAKESGRKVLLALHHPPVTPGKRAFHNDISLYLSKQEIASEAFNSCFGKLMHEHSVSYNTLMLETFKQQKLVFDAIFAAHDHDIYYYNNKESRDMEYPVCQITSGGGGGGLQERESFDQQQDMGCFLKRHGFTVVDCPQGDRPLHFNICTVPKSQTDRAFHLHFDSADHRPYRTYPKEMLKEEKEATEQFCRVVEIALYRYLGEFLGPRQKREKGSFLGTSPISGNVSHGKDGVERAHTIWAYICQAHGDSLLNTLKTVHSLSRWGGTFTSPTAHSFITLLNAEIEKKYGKGMNMDRLIETVEKQQRNERRFF